jgi:hypothetical protein
MLLYVVASQTDRGSMQPTKQVHMKAANLQPPQTNHRLSQLQSQAS